VGHLRAGNHLQEQAKITDLFGRPLRYNSREVQNRNGIVASNGVAHEKIIASLKPMLTEFGRLPFIAQI